MGPWMSQLTGVKCGGAPSKERSSEMRNPKGIRSSHPYARTLPIRAGVWCMEWIRRARDRAVYRLCHREEDNSFGQCHHLNVNKPRASEGRSQRQGTTYTRSLTDIEYVSIPYNGQGSGNVLLASAGKHVSPNFLLIQHTP